MEWEQGLRGSKVGGEREQGLRGSKVGGEREQGERLINLLSHR